MIQIAIVIFREFLEISILLGLFSAAAGNIKDFKYLLNLGILIGVLGSVIIALFTEQISNSLDGVGSEIFSALIILVTVLMIISTVVWMKNHAKNLKASIYRKANSIDSGIFSKVIFTILIASTIFREGAEIVLLIHSIATIENNEVFSYINAFILGGGLGVVAGVAVCKGIFRFATKYIFTVSSVFMTFIAAGLSAEAAKILSSIGVISFLQSNMWDTSYIVSDSSIIGKILKILFGYSAKPSGVEGMFYLSTLLIIVILTKIFAGKKLDNHL